MLPQPGRIRTRTEETPAETWTPVEQQEFDKLLKNYDKFRARMVKSPRPDLETFAAIHTLKRILAVTIRIVELVSRGGTRLERRTQTALWALVAEAEEQTADLLHRLASLRRNLR